MAKNNYLRNMNGDFLWLSGQIRLKHLKYFFFLFFFIIITLIFKCIHAGWEPRPVSGGQPPPEQTAGGRRGWQHQLFFSFFFPFFFLICKTEWCESNHLPCQVFAHLHPPPPPLRHPLDKGADMTVPVHTDSVWTMKMFYYSVITSCKLCSCVFDDQFFFYIFYTKSVAWVEIVFVFLFAWVMNPQWTRPF